MDFVSSDDDGRKANPAPPLVGDEISDVIGVVAHGEASSRDDVVSLCWVRERMVEAARAATRLLAADEHKDAAEMLRWGGAVHAAFVELASNDRARAGDLLDVADLYVAGRGSVAELAEAVAGGDYRDAPRDEDDHVDYMAIRLTEIAAEEAAKKAGFFSVADAADILERNLRCGARWLASRPHVRGEFDVFVWVKDNVRQTLTGAVAFIALAGEDGTRPVSAAALGDVMEIRATHRGSITGIAADVLAGKYRDYPRDADGELVFNGRSRARERRVEHRQAMDRFWAGSGKPPASPSR